MARTGWKPTTFDGRDYPLELAHFDRRTYNPDPRVTLQHPFPVRDQGKVPCCVSCSITVAIECLDHFTPPARGLSPLYHYWKSRSRNDAEDRLVELTLRDGLQAAVESGIAGIDQHDPPFNREGALMAPSEAADRSAEERRLAAYDPILDRPAYFAVNGSAQWTSALRNGMPLIIGFWVTEAYQSISPEHPVHGPVPSQSSSTGHSVAILGFDEGRSIFLAKDSQGAAWGNGGTWWLPYSVADSNLVDSAYALGRILERN